MNNNGSLSCVSFQKSDRDNGSRANNLPTDIRSKVITAITIHNVVFSVILPYCIPVDGYQHLGGT
jgi:hypothetical protein